ncbi:MAG: hypothetical protein WKF70_07145 [Chitinophagaceae bacterium]
MRLPLNIAAKLLAMIEKGTSVPASAMQGEIVQKMIENGVIQKKQTGRSRALLMIKDSGALSAYLYNQFGIPDLASYTSKLSTGHLMRSEAVIVSGNSKLRAVRTFQGFLVNCYSPVAGTLRGQPYIVKPLAGGFTFIFDYEYFIPAATITIVYIENPENFRYIDLQAYLFSGITPLFVCRYPHSNDLLKWLRDIIPNHFVYFGDLDFAGINIYLNEYKKHLGTRASYLIPGDVETLIEKYGNRELYDRQLKYSAEILGNEEGIISLMELFKKYKRVLEQEVFIRQGR